MNPLTLRDISRFVGGALHDIADADLTVSGPVVIDSRKVESGSLFAALRGEHMDGHRFARPAVAAGAACVLAERPVGVPAVVVPDVQRALGDLARHTLARLPAARVVAVTGSSGKTSTKDLLAQVLAAHDTTVATPLSYNNEIGLPLSVLQADERTRFLVLEMGARGVGEIAHLTRIAAPEIAVVTNVGTAHIGAFGGAEAIRTGKGELVEALPLGGLAVLNADDRAVLSMRCRTAAPTLTYGTGHADMRATDVRTDRCGRAVFTLRHRGQEAAVRMQLHGAHHAVNAAAAAAVATAVGMDLREVAEALAAARRLTPGRMEVLERADGVTVVNDAFNANPDSMRAALAALVSMAGDRRTVAVLGEMRELGEQAPRHHTALGRRAAEAGVTQVIAVGGADAARVSEAAEQAGAGAARVSDGHAARVLLDTLVRAGDVVLFKGSHAVGLEDTAQQFAADGAPPEGRPS
ncbi:UDP-N-acetylmuramoyl-tripeptide--D-alanyl-D-alanine ligase [Streptomyces sp. WAC06614]|uniref:UDP-N-acetylmuramoyl-tripeptide--D-alanyl-D- alanine ligase n=1 Tax=Streptomyces sp. WAC06614 TaxID=2487416 RepID=UPI000F7B458B|nr:UDP-N-acetylmuramoyl-tripeptide--D-alanyl-D-alanine ligase [Streptomyces sp. WAC06614]RSS79760.1 UDP-N-acetylmuramoyl-tripeptide--D-alanyl-D-alanine ligase [Streptomyces sp. WAC06614]